MKTLYTNSLLALFSILLSLSASAQLPGSGNAYDFAFNYASTPHNAILNPTGNLTLEAWIKADSWGANPWENVIISKDGWQFGEQGYTLRAGASGTLSFNFGTPGSWIEVTSSPYMVQGEWYHVAGVYDGSYLKVYINGMIQDSTAFTGTIAASTYDLTIGRIAYTAGGTRDFDGIIDEVRIWNEAVSQATLRDHMCKKVTNTHPNYAALAAYYNMDETSGTTLVDQSTNALNGSLVGPTRVTSAAPIGDESAHMYAPGSISVNSAGVDTVVVDMAGNSLTMHLYRVDMAPNDPVAPAGYDTIDQTHYYGVWAPTTGALAYNVTYHYGTNALAAGANEPLADLADRVDNSSTPWTGTNATLDMNANTLSQTYLQRAEIILAREACPLATLDQSGPQVVCGGVPITVSELTGGWTTYQWLNAGVPIAGATNASYDISAAGTYTLVASNGVCVDTSATLTVTAAANPSVSFGTLSANHCDNDADAAITGGTPAAGTYSGTGISGSTFSPSGAGAGSVTLYYSYTDTVGCTGIDSTTVTVHAAPDVTIANWPDACVNDAPFALTGATPAGGNYSGPGVSGNNFDASTAGTGTHSIVYSYTDGNGCSDVDSATIAVNAAPAPANISQNGAQMCATTGSNTVVWVDASGDVIPGETNSCYTATTDGMYGVVLTSPDGCVSDTAWFDMTHFSIGEPAWAATFTIGPNPVNDILQINNNGTVREFTIRLLDVQGRVVATQTLTGQSTIINMKSFDAGIYFVEITDEHGKMNRKVINGN